MLTASIITACISALCLFYLHGSAYSEAGLRVRVFIAACDCLIALAAGLVISRAYPIDRLGFWLLLPIGLHFIMPILTLAASRCEKPGIFLPSFVSAAVSALLCFEVLRRSEATVLCVFLLLWLCYCAVTAVVAAGRLSSEKDARRTAASMERHYAMQEEYYEALLRKQEETRALWHDIEKYMRAADAETMSTEAYSRARAMLASASDVVDVGDRVLNVILNEYHEKAAAAGVELALRVQVQDEPFVAVSDLYVLIGNTADNAIEACLGLPPERRRAELTIRQLRDTFFYKIANPYSEQTKKAGARHGYGLKNVRSCVKKYGGSVEIGIDNGFFTLAANLNRPGR